MKNIPSFINGGLRLSLVALLLLLISCSTSKYDFAPSSIVPGAIGTVKVKKDKNNNYSVELEVTHLASPENLSPARKFYVVWMETEDLLTKNIGQITSSHGLFSKTKKASLSTISSFKPIKVFITAQDDASATSPGGERVLETSNF